MQSRVSFTVNQSTALPGVTFIHEAQQQQQILLLLLLLHQQQQPQQPSTSREQQRQSTITTRSPSHEPEGALRHRERQCLQAIYFKFKNQTSYWPIPMRLVDRIFL